MSEVTIYLGHNAVSFSEYFATFRTVAGLSYALLRFDCLILQVIVQNVGKSSRGDTVSCPRRLLCSCTVSLQS